MIAVALVIASAGNSSPPKAYLRQAEAELRAGQLPQALLTYRRGVRNWPADRALRRAQTAARDRVRYSEKGKLRGRARPQPSQCRVGRWLSLGALQWLTVLGYLLGWAGFSWSRIRRGRYLGAAAFAGWLTALAGGLALLDEYRRHRRQASETWGVVQKPTTLRQGNSPRYPAAITPQLPRGVEAKVLHRRGDWLQVELADRTRGWLPQSAVLVEVAEP